MVAPLWQEVVKAGRTTLAETEAKAVIAAAGIPVTMPRPAASAREAAALACEIGFPVVVPSWKEVVEAGRTTLTETEAKAVIAAAGIPVTMPRPAASAREAAALACEIGFPVVLKIDSPDILHKSDVRGVRLGLASRADVLKAYDEMLAHVKERAPAATRLGITVQPMAPSGIEVIVGASKDPQFGPVVMVGLGGMLVELLQDVAFRVVPIDRWDAREMMRAIRGYRLLAEGFRGQGPVDIAALEDVLLKVSRLVETNPWIRELDLNPVFAYKEGAVAVDARISLEPE